MKISDERLRELADQMAEAMGMLPRRQYSDPPPPNRTNVVPFRRRTADGGHAKAVLEESEQARERVL